MINTLLCALLSTASYCAADIPQLDNKSIEIKLSMKKKSYTIKESVAVVLALNNNLRKDIVTFDLINHGFINSSDIGFFYFDTAVEQRYNKFALPPFGLEKSEQVIKPNKVSFEELDLRHRILFTEPGKYTIPYKLVYRRPALHDGKMYLLNCKDSGTLEFEITKD